MAVEDRQLDYRSVQTASRLQSSGCVPFHAQAPLSAVAHLQPAGVADAAAVGQILPGAPLPPLGAVRLEEEVEGAVSDVKAGHVRQEVVADCETSGDVSDKAKRRGESDEAKQQAKRLGFSDVSSSARARFSPKNVRNTKSSMTLSILYRHSCLRGKGDGWFMGGVRN